jgi:hypothetical protein
MAVHQQLRRSPPATNGTSSGGGLAGAAASQRSTPLALVGVASVVVGALVFFGIYTGIDTRQSVLVAARPVAAGQVVTSEDLRVADVAASEGTAVVPAAQIAAVVGQTAAVSLVPGAILAPSQLGASSGLQAGQAQVGVALKPGQAPLGLRKGSRVKVVDSGGAVAGEDIEAVVLSSDAVVSDVGATSASSATTVVSLSLAESDATAVAAAGVAGRVSLVVLPS